MLLSSRRQRDKPASSPRGVAKVPPYAWKGLQVCFCGPTKARPVRCWKGTLVSAHGRPDISLAFRTLLSPGRVALLLPRLLHSSLPRNHHRCWLLNAVFLALAAARGLGPSRRWQQQTFRPEYCEGEEVAGECRWPDGESGGLSPRLVVCSPAAAAGRGRSQVLLFRRRGGGGGGNGARRRACAAAALVSSFLVRSFSSGAAAARGLIGGGEDS